MGANIKRCQETKETKGIKELNVSEIMGKIFKTEFLNKIRGIEEYNSCRKGVEQSKTITLDIIGEVYSGIITIDEVDFRTNDNESEFSFIDGKSQNEIKFKVKKVHKNDIKDDSEYFLILQNDDIVRIEF